MKKYGSKGGWGGLGKFLNKNFGMRFGFSQFTKVKV